MKHEIWELQSMQALPLSAKVSLTKQRIREWVNEYGEDGVYVSFSGGKDSTVLLHIAREEYPGLKAVFSDTGLEFPETREFVKQFDNVDWVRPKMSFVEVIKKYGYPMISKEVSECVWGARKYLTQVIESESALNERTNERTNERSGMPRNTVSYADLASIAKNSRGGWTTSSANSEESESTNVLLGMDKTHRNRAVWKAVQQASSSHFGGWRTLAFY